MLVLRALFWKGLLPESVFGLSSTSKDFDGTADLPPMPAASAAGNFKASVENPVSGASLSSDGVNKDAVPLKTGKLRKLGGECSGTVHALSCRRLPPPKRTCTFSSLDCRVSPGKNKDTWQEQEFTLTNEELWWTSKQVRKSVKLADMGTVAEWSDIGIGHAFEIITRVKDGKVYKFSATDDADRDAWIDQLRIVIPPA